MKLLYEDKEIIVCEKPAGTASQNERGFTADMVSLLMTHEKESGVSVSNGTSLSFLVYMIYNKLYMSF